MYSLEIEIPLHATDSNKILGVNKYAKHSLFKKVKSQVGLLCLGRTPKAPLTKFQITAIRYSIRPLDFDNFVASLKPFVDALTLSKVIKDDSWDFIKRIDVDQVKSKEKKLVIKVKEL
jgi:Holliday junction resolvase RusA-like endonuclease